MAKQRRATNVRSHQKKAPARKAARPSRKTVKTSQARRTTKPSKAGGSTARPSKAAVKRPVAT
ncbi:MAG: hypothetical protein ABIP65_01135, partial [Vicinamibacterales bacterium]